MPPRLEIGFEKIKIRNLKDLKMKLLSNVLAETNWKNMRSRTEASMKCPTWRNTNAMQKNDNLRKWLELLPQQYKKMELKDLKQVPEKLILRGVEWPKDDQLMSMYLFGPWGSGKTSFAISLIRHAMETLNQKGYFWPKMFTALELDKKLLAASRDTEIGDYQMIKDIAEEDLLFIDDLDKINPSDRFKSQFFEIINQRYMKNLPTIITSNVMPSDLAQLLDGSIVSRMSDADKWRIIKFPDRDLRKLKIETFE
jgi:DNA replication protein DnaC